MAEKNLKKEQKEQLIFFNNALDYYERNYIIAEESSQENTMNWSPRNILRDEMLSELDNLREILTHDLSFKDLTQDEIESICNFMADYSRCPICGGFNHTTNLKEIFQNKDYYKMIKDLSHKIEINKVKTNLNINLGIPCCICYKIYLQNENAD